MSKKFLVFIAIIAILSGMVGAWLITAASGAHPATIEKESAYERVMRTQTLRCGYVVWVPFLLKDPVTGQISGLFHDYTEALGALLHLKIDWVEEEGWGDFPSALEAGRIDAMCGGSWPNATRGRQIDFVQPILYQPTYAWVRSSDNRFDHNVASINDPKVTIVLVEGTTQPLIAAQDFPQAKTLQLPELTSLAETLISLVGGKADVALTTSQAAYQYDLNNPGKIKRVEGDVPLRLYGNGLAVGGGQDRLRRMLDIATEEMINSGQIEKIIAKYDNIPGALLRTAEPYQSEKKP